MRDNSFIASAGDIPGYATEVGRKAFDLRQSQQMAPYELAKAQFEQKMQPYKMQEAQDNQDINKLKVMAQKNDLALKYLGAAEDPQQWLNVRQGLITQGLAKPEEIPETYSPDFVRKTQMAHLDFKSKLDNEFRQKQLVLQREALADKRADRQENSAMRTRYYDILEKNAMTKAGETVDPDTGEIVPSKKKTTLPVGALKLQEEGLDNLATAKSIDADLGAFQEQIRNGELKLSLGGNLIDRARNAVGASNTASKNFASFKAGLETIRSNSLRLNKGTQTEGDAVRAWNELFENINDTDVVNQRLGEIRNINQRAAEIQKNKVRTVRENYGADDLDYSPYENVKAAPTGGKNKKSGGWSIEPVE